MLRFEITHTLSNRCLLGEGPVYSDRYQCAFWVDIWGQSLYQLDWADESLHQYSMPEPVCWLAETEDGRLVAGFKQGIYELDPHTFSRKSLVELQGEPDSNRLNDAKTDRSGHLFFGTMDNQESAPSGSLYRLDQDLRAQVLDTGYVVSNGPAVNLAGNRLYSTDSAEQKIHLFDLDDQGRLSNKRPFVTFSAQMGFPDGMTVDSDDHLWVAAWDGFGLYRFDPEGQQTQYFPLAVPRPTSVTFIGPHRDRLLITSASVGLSEQVLAKYPQSGATFLADAGVVGVADTPFKLNR